MKILVINCGSSSLKYQLFDMADEKVLCKGSADRIGQPISHHRHERGGECWNWDLPLPNHRLAVQKMVEILLDPQRGSIASVNDIHAVGHRIVHGGPKYTRPVIVDDTVLADIESFAIYAPLHNPAHALGIRAAREVWPRINHVVVFDTAFHHTMPPYAYLYGLNYDLAAKYGIRRYGFHGTSHRWVSERAAGMLNKSISSLKAVTCHIGNGTSITAIDGGKSVDTSMGMTPLQGVIMGTRTGTMDPMIVEFLMEKEHLDYKQIDDLMNKKSGLLGLSGLSSDIRDLEKAALEGHQRARLALDVHTHQIRKFIGSYVFTLGGVDAIVFTAGVGENSVRCRAEVCRGLEFLGAKLDDERNRNARGESVISTDGSKTKLLVIPTNEELLIARDTLELSPRDEEIPPAL